MVASRLVAFALLCSVAACDAGRSGKLAAASLGDVSRPAHRGSPIAGLREACGDGAPTDSGHVVRRHAYLQQVTPTSAMVGWVTTAPDGEHVEITKPDGSHVASVPATVEHAKPRNAGEHQMWARVSNLEPNTVYCYRVANGSPLLAPTGFRTAPAEDSTERVRFLAFGDSGTGEGDQHSLLQQMFEVPYEVIVHTGDIAYDSGTLAQLEDNVFGVYNELLRNIPMFPVAGNHEYETADGAPFRQVFALPGTEKWYSFDWGPIHFAAIDTEQDYAAQAAWLDADLAATTKPWKIVFTHKPPYSSGEHGSDKSLRNRLAPIMQKHGVQLVLSGHDHNYERTTSQGGITYVVTGGGGRHTRPVSRSSFTAFAEEVIHFVYVEVGPDELVLHAVDASGREFDSVVIPRSAS